MPALEVEDLTVWFPGQERPAVEAVSFTLAEGQIAILIGPNGSGKSTVLRAILGLVPFTGTIRVTGLGVDLIDPIKEAAEAALGFTLAFDVTDTVTARNKVVTQPDALDIFSGYFNDIDQVWPSGNMAPVSR